jgi:hypothetical protein
MSEEIIAETEELGNQFALPSTPQRAKRTLVRFKGDEDTVYNLDYVSMIKIKGKVLELTVDGVVRPHEFVDEAAVLEAYENILNMWAFN